MDIVRSLCYFIIAGIFEIGGGYLIWQWLKEDKPFWYGILGGIILALYGVVATWQTANFGRVYATYGGVFIVLALIWAWKVDGFKPDKYDIVGASIALIGACRECNANCVSSKLTPLRSLYSPEEFCHQT